MNKVQRAKVVKMLEAVSKLITEIEEMRDEEQEKLDNVPESLQSGDKYDALENGVYSLESALDSINEVSNYLEEVIEVA